MRTESKRSLFGRSAVLALAYALAYAGLREVNIGSIGYNNWMPMARPGHYPALSHQPTLEL
jgi:hypothetical protein